VNPFDLTGPEFLLFYLVLAAVVIAALVLWQWQSESRSAMKIELADPYLIASLRGGDNEVIRVALVSLIDRGLLIVNETQIQRADHASPDLIRPEIERELIKKCETPREVSALFNDAQVNSACVKYPETLQKARLIPDESLIQRRWARFWIALSILGGVAGIKIMVALGRGRTNVLFLVILMIVAIVLAYKTLFPRLTAAGAAILADVRTLYAGLKERAASIRPGGATIDAMMLAAVFGVGMLEGEAFGYTKRLFPSAKSSAMGSTWVSSCSSSCGISGGGSSCSGGSGCGGGGCGGGCGGCGS
jgi:uncharacterized protein (TIGR04222 family)